MSSTQAPALGTHARQRSHYSTTSVTLDLSTSNLDKVDEQDREALRIDTILPWMKGFEKRYHPVEYEYDIVKCVCGFSCPDSEETREMVQCDQCGNWQHIPCLKLKNGDIPLDYFCHHCLPERHAHLLQMKAFKKSPASARSSKRVKLSAVTDRLHYARPTKTTGRTRSARYDTTSIQSVEELKLDADLKLMKTFSNHSQRMIELGDIGQATGTRVQKEDLQGEAQQIEAVKAFSHNGIKSAAHASQGAEISGVHQDIQPQAQTSTTFDGESDVSMSQLTPTAFVDRLALEYETFNDMVHEAELWFCNHTYLQQNELLSWKAWAELNSVDINLARLALETKFPILRNYSYRHASLWLLNYCWRVSHHELQHDSSAPNSRHTKEPKRSNSQITFKVTKRPQSLNTKSVAIDCPESGA